MVQGLGHLETTHPHPLHSIGSSKNGSPEKLNTWLRLHHKRGISRLPLCCQLLFHNNSDSIISWPVRKLLSWIVTVSSLILFSQQHQSTGIQQHDIGLKILTYISKSRLITSFTIKYLSSPLCTNSGTNRTCIIFLEQKDEIYESLHPDHDNRVEELLDRTNWYQG